MSETPVAPLISVIVPCYNAERYIAQTLKSLLWQTEQRWECIVVDDGSTDRSRDVVAGFMKEDARLTLISQPNQGPTKARNKGVTHARGSFIQFLDADDLLLPERFARCLREFDEHPEYDIVYSDYVLFRTNEGFQRSLPARIPGDDTVKAMLFDLNVRFVVLMHSYLFRSPVVVATPFDTSYPMWSEDQECWVRMALAQYRFAYIDAVLVVYRFTQNNLTSNEAELISAKLTMVERYSERPELERYRTEFAEAKIYLHQRLVMAYFMERSFRNGWNLLRKQWSQSSRSARIKMAGWGIVMTVFSKKSVISLRAWIVKYTPFAWGGWKGTKMWEPSIELKRLVENP